MLCQVGKTGHVGNLKLVSTRSGPKFNIREQYFEYLKMADVY